ncbi:hypothetical protein [Marinilabilia salmonicolor]|jgi:hypothetical protein|uniref:DUF3037 family protein n=1 Tax=Marinilabilia salmonicolor TaxID=989 RepID=A0A2T0XHA7_9BACT|nr:hypothetical protein [Marinilabilia salmonicolor]PRY98287.1 hypothetical protein BY457_11099 [Marinilabilia salmonicolor]RCW33861.1 hypothetical protein DFO77_11223 [Marinilabilia salmonicolor]
MKTFYSLIKISPNSLSDDSLVIGMILSDQKGFRYKFSQRKKRIAKGILTSDSRVLDYLEKEITHKLDELNTLAKKSKAEPEIFDLKSSFSSEYFEYLSRYSNGLLKFTAPNFITDQVNAEKFQKLFRMFVDQVEETEINPEKEEEKHFNERINTNLIERVKEKVHIHKKFDHNFTPSLVTPFEMDCVGRNGVFVGAKSLYFTHSRDKIHKATTSYVNLIVHLSYGHQKEPFENKFFLIADEPEQKKSFEHQIWNDLRKKERLFSVISSDDASMVAETIENSGASKFLDL